MILNKGLNKDKTTYLPGSNAGAGAGRLGNLALEGCENPPLEGCENPSLEDWENPPFEDWENPPLEGCENPPLEGCENPPLEGSENPLLEVPPLNGWACWEKPPFDGWENPLEGWNCVWNPPFDCWGNPPKDCWENPPLVFEKVLEGANPVCWGRRVVVEGRDWNEDGAAGGATGANWPNCWN